MTKYATTTHTYHIISHDKTSNADVFILSLTSRNSTPLPTDGALRRLAFRAFKIGILNWMLTTHDGRTTAQYTAEGVGGYTIDDFWRTGYSSPSLRRILREHGIVKVAMAPMTTLDAPIIRQEDLPHYEPPTHHPTDQAFASVSG